MSATSGMWSRSLPVRDEKCVDRALKLIKVQYEVLEPLLDFRKAKDNRILVHPEDNWESLVPVGADNKRNLCAHDESGEGDIEKVLRESDVVIDHVYHTKACQQTMMETFRTFCTIDAYGRLNVVSSTQIVFHCRRIIANALPYPEVHDPRQQAEDRRRIRCEADIDQRGLSGLCDLDDKETVKDHLYPRGEHDRLYTAP